MRSSLAPVVNSVAKCKRGKLMTPLDPKTVAALQAFRSALTGLSAPGVPVPAPVAQLHSTAALALLGCYEALMGMPAPK